MPITRANNKKGAASSNAVKPIETYIQKYQSLLHKINRINDTWNEHRDAVCYQFTGHSGREFNQAERWLLETEAVVTIPEEKPAKAHSAHDDDVISERQITV